MKEKINSIYPGPIISNTFFFFAINFEMNLKNKVCSLFDEFLLKVIRFIILVLSH